MTESKFSKTDISGINKIVEDVKEETSMPPKNYKLESNNLKLRTTETLLLPIMVTTGRNWNTLHHLRKYRSQEHLLEMKN